MIKIVNQKLLEKEFEFYKNKDIKMKPINYNKGILSNLFNKFKFYGMTEQSYCCYGEECCCWCEVVEEGNFSLTLERVKETILSNIDYVKKYLYNQRKYGKRLYIYEDKECCYLYIYCRDVAQVDYAIWFSNKE